MLPIVYPVIQGFVLFVVMVVLLLMILRLIFNYTDPNPFGIIGRFSFKLKKVTDRFVYPIASFLAYRRVDTRISPLIAVLIAVVIGFFVLQLFYTLFETVDGVAAGLRKARITLIAGYLLYGFLGLYSLLIVVRIIMSWFSSSSNRVLRFLISITDPVLEPFRRLIPPLGMFDISPIIVLFLIHFVRIAVYGVFGLGRI